MRGPDLSDPHRTNVEPVTGDRTTVHHVTDTHGHAPAGMDPKLAEQIRKDAYKAGVADEAARHKRNPLLSILIALAAVLGLAVIVLYFVNGRSFSGAGQTLDEAAGVAGEQAKEAGREAADETGEGLQDLGRTVEERAAQPPSDPNAPPPPVNAAPAAAPAAPAAQ